MCNESENLPPTVVLWKKLLFSIKQEKGSQEVGRSRPTEKVVSKETYNPSYV